MLVQFFDWGSSESVTSSMTEISLGDVVVVQHKWGLFTGSVVDNSDTGSTGHDVVGQVIRKATAQDLEVALKNKQVEKVLKKDIKKTIRNYGLAMKIAEVRLSIDSGCVVVIFTADNRIDFREAVKSLSAELGKSVRFQQVGSRDEAKKLGGFGICGRELCCTKFSRGLKSITTDMARSQNIAHRGAERLSGLCGRLMCCLSYESEQYDELGKVMPTRGAKIEYEGQEAQVTEVIVLEQKLKILLADGSRKIVELSDVRVLL